MRVGLALALLLLAGCEKGAAPGAGAATSASGATASAAPAIAAAVAEPASSLDKALAEVDRVHGGHGPWAVSGYRMGQYALAKLGLARQAFDLEVVHHSPLSPQYACVADGAAAATGASTGKLNLKLVEATAEKIHTVYKNRATGATLVLRPSAKFVARFKDVPMPELAAAGKTAMGLPDADVFEEAPADKP